MSLPLPDLHTLRAFVAVARTGSVSRAAAQLHLSQPAVSLQLKRLAQEAGLQLFARTAQGMALSNDGAALLRHAERALAAASDFQQAAQRLHSTVRGVLRIGTILDPEFIRLGAFLRELVESAPQVATELRHGMSGSVLDQVGRGDLDIGYFLGDANLQWRRAHRAQADLFAACTLSRFTYRVVAPAGWGARVRGRDWAALADLPWLATPPASAHHRLLADVFAPRGLTPRHVALVDQEASMLDLIKSGVGLSLVRDSVAIRESQAHGLVIADGVQLDCDLSMVWVASRGSEPVLAAALAALARVWP